MGLEGFDVGESRTRSTSGPRFDSEQIHVKDIEIGWLAGIVEGEGSIMVIYPKDRAYRLRICVEMTDLDIITRLHTLTGMGTIVSTNRNNPNWKPTWRWQVQAKKEVVALAKLLRPHMGSRRTEQIDKLLAVVEG